MVSSVSRGKEKGEKNNVQHTRIKKRKKTCWKRGDDSQPPKPAKQQ